MSAIATLAVPRVPTRAATARALVGIVSPAHAPTGAMPFVLRAWFDHLLLPVLEERADGEHAADSAEVRWRAIASEWRTRTERPAMPDPVRLPREAGVGLGVSGAETPLRFLRDAVARQWPHDDIGYVLPAVASRTVGSVGIDPVLVITLRGLPLDVRPPEGADTRGLVTIIRALRDIVEGIASEAPRRPSRIVEQVNTLLAELHEGWFVTGAAQPRGAMTFTHRAATHRVAEARRERWSRSGGSPLAVAVRHRDLSAAERVGPGSLLSVGLDAGGSTPIG